MRSSLSPRRTTWAMRSLACCIMACVVVAPAFSQNFQMPPSSSARISDATPSNVAPVGVSPGRMALPSGSTQAASTTADPWLSNRSTPTNTTRQESPSPQPTDNLQSSRRPQTIRPEARTAINPVQSASYTEPAAEPSLSSNSASMESGFASGSNTASGSNKIHLPLRPPSEASKGNIESPKTPWTSLISMVASLMMVIGIFLGLAWMLRRTTQTHSNALPKEIVQVLGRCPMAPRQQLYLLRFGPKLVLVTHQAGQTETLCEIDDPMEVDRIAGICEQSKSGSASQSFRQVLNQVAMGQNQTFARKSPTR
ncbi:MAG: flagellar biosynthetic protein FliO [Pirellulales bacterium]